MDIRSCLYTKCLQWCIKYYGQDPSYKIYSLLLMYRENESIFKVLYEVISPWKAETPADVEQSG